MSTSVALMQQDRIARVTFLSEKGVQVFSKSTRGQLSAVLQELEQSDEARAVVFEAEGRTFIAGADLNELKTLDAESAVEFAREGQQLMDRIASLKQVTIAAVHAACAGGGCELALACDLRMAAKSARIGLPEVSLGVIPGWGGTVRAVRLLGSAAARRLILTGELLSAKAAYRLGLVDAVVPDTHFRAAVDERLGQLLSRGPSAVQTAQRLIAEFDGAELAAKFEAEARAFGACYATGEPGEGIAAFLEKREPDWE